jgi:hypothetical protein
MNNAHPTPFSQLIGKIRRNFSVIASGIEEKLGQDIPPMDKIFLPFWTRYSRQDFPPIVDLHFLISSYVKVHFPPYVDVHFPPY